MIYLLFSATSVLFFVSLVSNTVLYLSVLESKSFKIDKLFLSFKSRELLRLLFFNWTNGLKMATLTLYFLTIPYYSITDYYPFIVFGIFLLSAIKNAGLLRRKNFHFNFFNPSIIIFFSP